MSDAGRLRRVAEYNEAVRPNSYIADKSENATVARWKAIEREYIRFRQGEIALPHSRPQDRFCVMAKSKKTGEIIDAIWADRQNQKQVSDQLAANYENISIYVSVIGKAPFNPRKGEPSYKQWLAGARPDLKLLHENHLSSMEARRAERVAERDAMQKQMSLL